MAEPGQFLNIGEKADSLEKLAKVEGKPAEYYLFAREINLMANRIRTLWSSILSMNSALGDIIDANPKIELGTITEDFLTLLNLLPNATFEVPTFVIYKVGTTNYVQMFVGTNGEYGTETDNVLTANDFALISESETPPAATTKFFRGRIWGDGTNRFLTSSKNSLGTIITLHPDSTNFQLTIVQTDVDNNPVNFDLNKTNVTCSNISLEDSALVVSPLIFDNLLILTAGDFTINPAEFLNIYFGIEIEP